MPNLIGFGSIQSIKCRDLTSSSLTTIASFAFLLLQVFGGPRDEKTATTVTVKTISEAGAQQVLLAAEHEAEWLHAPYAIAVVDESGILIAFLRMDGVRAGSPDLAIGKARTSVLLQWPSAETESNVDTGRFSFVTSAS